MKLTEQEVINIFTGCAMTVDRARNYFGFTLKPIGSGVFRRAFRVNGLPLVAKFCREGVPFAKQHAIHEYTFVANLENSKGSLSKHIPTIYCCDNNGTILMKEYKSLKKPKKHTEYKKLMKYIKRHFNNEYDLDNEQFGVDNKNNLVILDWGFVGNDSGYAYWNEIGYKCQEK